MTSVNRGTNELDPTVLNNRTRATGFGAGAQSLAAGLNARRRTNAHQDENSPEENANDEPTHDTPTHEPEIGEGSSETNLKLSVGIGFKAGSAASPLKSPSLKPGAFGPPKLELKPNFQPFSLDEDPLQFNQQSSLLTGLENTYDSVVFKSFLKDLNNSDVDLTSLSEDFTDNQDAFVKMALSPQNYMKSMSVMANVESFMHEGLLEDAKALILRNHDVSNVPLNDHIDAYITAINRIALAELPPGTLSFNAFATASPTTIDLDTIEDPLVREALEGFIELEQSGHNLNKGTLYALRQDLLLQKSMIPLKIAAFNDTQTFLDIVESIESLHARSLQVEEIDLSYQTVTQLVQAGEINGDDFYPIFGGDITATKLFDALRELRPLANQVASVNQSLAMDLMDFEGEEVEVDNTNPFYQWNSGIDEPIPGMPAQDQNYSPITVADPTLTFADDVQMAPDPQELCSPDEEQAREARRAKAQHDLDTELTSAEHRKIATNYSVGTAAERKHMFEMGGNVNNQPTSNNQSMSSIVRDLDKILLLNDAYDAAAVLQEAFTSENTDGEHSESTQETLNRHNFDTGINFAATKIFALSNSPEASELNDFLSRYNPTYAKELDNDTKMMLLSEFGISITEDGGLRNMIPTPPEYLGSNHLDALRQISSLSHALMSHSEDGKATDTQTRIDLIQEANFSPTSAIGLNVFSGILERAQEISSELSVLQDRSDALSDDISALRSRLDEAIDKNDQAMTAVQESEDRTQELESNIHDLQHFVTLMENYTDLPVPDFAPTIAGGMVLPTGAMSAVFNTGGRLIQIRDFLEANPELKSFLENQGGFEFDANGVPTTWPGMGEQGFEASVKQLLQNQLSETQTDLETSRKNNKRLIEEYAAATEEVRQIERDLGGLEIEQAEIDTEVAQKEEEVEELEEQARGLPLKYQVELETVFDGLKDQLSQVKETQRQNQIQIHEIKEDLHILKNNLKKRGRALKKLAGLLGGLSKEMDVLLAEMDNIAKILESQINQQVLAQINEIIERYKEKSDELARTLDLSPMPESITGDDLLREFKEIIIETNNIFNQMFTEQLLESFLEQGISEAHIAETKEALTYHTEQIENLDTQNRERVQRMLKMATSALRNHLSALSGESAQAPVLEAATMEAQTPAAEVVSSRRRKRISTGPLTLPS